MRKLLIFSLISLILLIGLFSFLAFSKEEPKQMTDKEYNKDKYQKIETEYITFELPKQAIHYWTDSSGNNDRYEIIISNFSIKANDDYVLRLTWYDERYIDETIQIHYSFKNKKLKEQDIDLIPLSDYTRDCLMNLTDLNKNKTKKDCEKTIKKSKLKFNDVNIELGTLEGYEYRLEKDFTCLKCNIVNVSYPIYGWMPFKDINIIDLPDDFLAIDDVNISTCGTLATANENYTMNASIYYPSGDGCFIISADNITFNMAEYWLNGSTSSTTYGFNVKANNTIIRNGTIYSWQYYGIYQGDLASAGYVSNNLTIKNINFDWIDSYGAHILGDYNTVKDSNFSRIGSDVGYGGIYAEGDYLTIDNVYMNDMYEEGIILSGNYNTIIDSTIENIAGEHGTGAGIWFSEAGNSHIINNTKVINASYNIILDTTDHNIIQNSNFSFGRTNDVVVQTTSLNNTFLNVTYNTSKENVEAGSQLIRQWYYRAYVNDTDIGGVVVSDVNISIYNSSANNGNLVYNMSTGATGYTAIYEMIDYINLGGTITYYSNYTINANKTGYAGTTHYYNITSSKNNLKDIFFFTNPPTTPTLISPEDLSSTSETYVVLKYNSTQVDNATDGIEFWVYNSTDNIDFSLLFNGTGYGNSSYNWSGLVSGSYYWKVKAGDGYTNSSNSSAYKFTISTTVPAITLNYPANAYWFNTRNISFFNFTATDADGLGTCNLWTNTTEVWHHNQSTSSAVSGTMFSFNQTDNLTDERTYIWNINCSDAGGLSGFSPNNFTFYIDTIEPNATLTQPTGTKTTRANIQADWTVSDYSLDTCVYNVYRGINLEIANTSVTCSDNTTTFTVTLDADFTFNFYAIDSAGNVGSNSSSFTVDTTPAPTPPGGGGGAPKAVEIPPLINITEEIGYCGDGICREDRGETPLNCPRDCVKLIFNLKDIFCLPLLACGSWTKTWFINLVVVVLLGGGGYYFYKTKKAKRL